MRALDEVLLARFEPLPFEVHDGNLEIVPKGENKNVVTLELPYAVYYSSVGDNDEATRRLSADIPRDSVFWSITYVGIDRNQAKWAGEHIRTVLRRLRPTVPGFRCEVVKLLESQRVRRDDDAVLADGRPLFYGVDNYAAGLRHTL